MGCLAILAIPSAGVSFFFSAWIIMLFWGILAPTLEIKTIGYIHAMLVTIALWMALAPLVVAVGRRMVVRSWRSW